LKPFETLEGEAEKLAGSTRRRLNYRSVEEK